jgi:broad specificity phosphatase PhoE
VVQQRRTGVVYFIRHAEATHNIEEKRAIQQAIANGIHDKEEHEKARRAVLDDETLRDAPLSANGKSQVRQTGSHLSLLHKTGNWRYPPPKIVLVSPLRRALMTATELFGSIEQQQQQVEEDSSTTTTATTITTTQRPIFIAMEILREKRTGFAADERSSVDALEQEFPHVDFTDLKRLQKLDKGASTTPTKVVVVPIGEDNAAVRNRARAFLQGPLASLEEDAIAIVTHKGWLREMRKTIKGWVDHGTVHVDFDLDQWDQTLYGNAELRVAEFSWIGRSLTSIVSKSVENALGFIVTDAVKHLLEERLAQLGFVGTTTGDGPFFLTG